MLKYLASVARAGVLLFTALVANPAWAANEVATSNAFEALLSLPQTQPDEGEWGHVAPEGFNGEDETALIRWLARQKKAGADFNQARHQGTLLHHAIRGGLEATALWLLTHGADPLKTLEGGEQADALALSIKYRRWSVANDLLKIPGITAPGRTPQLLLAWQAAQGEDERAVVDKLLAWQLPLPKGAAGERLLGLALERQWMKVALALLDAGITRAAPSAYGWAVSNKIGAAADIEAADARLAAPIFPYLLVHATNAGDVESLWRLRIRRPFEDAAFTRQVVLRILAAPSTPPVKRALLERLPPKALKTAFDDGEVIDRWVRWSAQLPPAEGDWALAVLGDIPVQRPAVLLDAMLKNAYWFDENGANSNQLADGWARLLARLHAPLPVETHGKLWMFVPRQHRPTLLRMGYRPGDKELADWLERDNKEAIRTLWPHIKAAVPALVERIHEPLLAPYSPENGYTCNWGGLRPESLEKARILLEAGAKPRKPVVLDAGCVAITDPAILHSLNAAGLIEFQAPTSAELRRFVPETPACRFQPNEVWRRSLIKHPSLGDIPIDGAQVISIPGATDCALLVWGGNAGGRTFFEEDSFTGTQRFSPCTDGHYAAAIWRVVGDTVQPIQLGEDMPAIQGALPLRDTVSGEHLLLVGQIGTGTCGTGTPLELLSWETAQNATATLRVLPRKSATMQAFLRQCGMAAKADAQGCFPPGGDLGESHYSFIDTHWASERKAYIDAVLALDYEALRKAQKTGIFPHWTAQAMDAVTKANIPVAGKRRRTAWLFRDAALLADSLQTFFSYDVLSGLVAWLPREDWQPVIKALQGNDSMLNHLRGEAERQGKPALACRFATALGRACGKVAP
ncbi:MAG TPA: hypothetical protein VN283_08110 [Thiobacillus sp.]|nr:hypothetical protein [Thiobacillus sp.]